MNKGILLYIDPGTGAMLFTVIMGLVTTLIFSLRKVWIKIKFFFSGGAVSSSDNAKMEFVIFSDSKRYWNVFKPICDELERRERKCWYWTASPDDPALQENYKYIVCEFIGEGNKAFAKLNMMKADICLSTTPGLDVYQWKRSDNVKYYVHIPHEIGEMTGYRMFGIDYYDAVLTTGDFHESYIRKLEELRGTAKKEIVVVGSNYMDEYQKRVELSEQEKKDAKKTVLVAPSWGESSILNRFGEKFLSALSDSEYKIVVRPHPQSKIVDAELLEDLQKKFPETDSFSWNYDNDNFPVLQSSDILISDFSGIIFEFALIFDRPIIYADTHLDKSPYDSCWLEEEPWRLSILPTIGSKLEEKNFSNIVELIETTMKDKSFENGRKLAKEQAWFYPGEATRRVVDYLVKKQEEITKVS